MEFLDLINTFLDAGDNKKQEETLSEDTGKVVLNLIDSLLSDDIGKKDTKDIFNQLYTLGKLKNKIEEKKEEPKQNPIKINKDNLTEEESKILESNMQSAMEPEESTADEDTQLYDTYVLGKKLTLPDLVQKLANKIDYFQDNPPKTFEEIEIKERVTTLMVLIKLVISQKKELEELCKQLNMNILEN